MSRPALGPVANAAAWLILAAAIAIGCVVAYRWPPSNEFVWQGHYHWRPVRPRIPHP